MLFESCWIELLRKLAEQGNERVGVERFRGEARDVCGDVVLFALQGCDLEVEEVAAHTEVVGRRIPSRKGDGFDRLRSSFSGLGLESRDRSGSIQVIVSNGAALFLSTTCARQQLNAIAETRACIYARYVINAISGSTNQLSHADNMHPCLRLSIRVFLQYQQGLLYNVLDLGQLNEVIDALALMLEVKARILEGVGGVDD
ncbi:hypothetical protein KC325_g18 [Hortaea werneckii]|nr:hypothetical protein KC325_g18 [Hortaea werneckii]